MVSLIRWALTGLRICVGPWNLRVLAVTDVPTYLLMHHTPHPPVMIESWRLRRGAPHWLKEPLFPKEWRAIAQNEVGFTKIKTFTLPLWPTWIGLWLLFNTAHMAFLRKAQAGPFRVDPLPWPAWQMLDDEPWTAP